MIDDFLAKLFGPDEPATFDQRFAPFAGAPANVPGIADGVGRPDLSRPPGMDEVLRQIAPPMPSPQEYLRGLTPMPDFPLAPPVETENAMLPPGARPTAFSPPGDGVPLPQPRPNIEAILNGERGGAGGGQLPSGAAPASPAPSLLDRLFGNGAPAGPAAREDRTSAIGKLFGLSEKSDQRIRASLASGLSGGNPAFAGGAAMKGVSGALSGGLSQEMQQQKDEKAAGDSAQKQANFDRSQGEKEKTGEAMRKLYGDRGAALKENAATRAANGGKTAWNKPASERWKDAQRLIIDKQKQLYGGLPIAGKARQDAQTKADQELEKFRRDTYKAYGIDEDGNDLGGAPMPRGGGAVPSTGKTVGDKEGTDTGLYPKGTYDDPAAPESQEEFDALPPGTVFKNPADGRLMTKRE